MELAGTRRIAADRAAVWAALHDARVLKAAIPGCQDLTGDPASGFAATVRQKVGPLSATFQGRLALSNVVEGRSCTLSGAAAGVARGAAEVRLEECGEGTLLSYEVKADVSGRLARLGARILDGFARKMADQFFETLARAVEGPGAAAQAVADGSGPADEKKPGWFRRLAGKTA